MKSRFDNGEVIVTYTDGSTDAAGAEQSGELVAD